MELFKLFGTIAVENEEANRDIDETTEKAENSESRMTGAFKKIGAAVATYFAVDKIVEFGKSITNAAAEVSAEQSAFEQIMGDYSNTAQEKINEIADTTGMVSTRLTPYMTSMTAKFKGLGFDIDDATTLAKDGLTLAADASAFWDKSLEDSMSGLNSFINGSYEGGEAIGLFANDTQLASYAVKKGIVGETKEWANLDEARKQATRLQYAQDMMKASGATGQAAKEADQYANVQANLTEKWRQFKAQIGEPLLQNVVLPAMEKLSGVVDVASQKFQQLQKWVSENQQTIQIVAGVVAVAAAAILGYNAAVTAMSIVQKATAWVKALNLAFAANPIGLVVAVIAALVTAFILLWNNCEGFRNFFISMWEGMKSAASAAWEFIKSAADTAISALRSGWDSFISFFSGLWDSITSFASSAWEAITSAATSVINGLVNGWNSFISFFTGLWNSVTSFLSTTWQTIQNVVTVGLMLIGEIISAAVQIILLPWQFIWQNCSQYIIAAWETIKTAVSTAINWVSNTIQTVFNAVYAFISSVWNSIVTAITNFANAILNVVKTIWNQIRSVTTTVFNAVSSVVSTIWNAIKTLIQNSVNTTKNIVTTVWNAISSVTSTVFNAVKNVATTVWNAIRTTIQNVLNAVRNVVTTVWNAISSVTSSVFNTIRNIATNIWNGIRSAIQSAVDSARSIVSGVWNSISSTTSSVFNGIRNTASSVWDSIKSAIQTPINAARDAVKSAIDRMRSFFNFSWSLPKLKLPHISISGSFSINPPSVPHFGISWYKEGGIMEDPTLFGFDRIAGKAMVGGEAGPEAIAPIDKLQDYVMAAVRAENGDVAAKIERLISILEKYFPLILAQMAKDIYLDSGELVGALGKNMDEELSDIMALRRRGQ